MQKSSGEQVAPVAQLAVNRSPPQEEIAQVPPLMTGFMKKNIMKLEPPESTTKLAKPAAAFGPGKKSAITPLLVDSKMPRPRPCSTNSGTSMPQVPSVASSLTHTSRASTKNMALPKYIA